MFTTMMIMSCALSITGAFLPGEWGFAIYATMVLIAAWQCHYMSWKYT